MFPSFSVLHQISAMSSKVNIAKRTESLLFPLDHFFLC